MRDNSMIPWHAEATLERSNGTYVLRHQSLEDCVRRFLNYATSTRRSLSIVSSQDIGGSRYGPYLLCGAEIERVAALLPIRTGVSAQIIQLPRR
jgi:hypothetical protein